MAVAVVDTGTAVYNSSATTQNYTFTIGATATLAVVFVVQDSTQSITSVTWDPTGANQAFTLIGSKTVTTSGAVYLYGLVNPTAGASKTVKVVNGTAVATSAELQSYSGTVTSSVAAACTNVLTATGGSSGLAGTAAQSGASGNMFISGFFANGTIATVAETTIYNLSPAGDDAAGNRFASTGSSQALTCNITGTWGAVSCDIVAGGAATFIAPPYAPILQAVKRASYW